MKVVYIAHPIAGDVQNNLKKISIIAAFINATMPDIIPHVPYYADAIFDAMPECRARGIANNQALFRKAYIDEVWMFGDKYSTGMQQEYELAREIGIPVLFKSTATMRAYHHYVISGLTLIFGKHNIAEFKSDHEKELEEVSRFEKSFADYIQANPGLQIVS